MLRSTGMTSWWVETVDFQPNAARLVYDLCWRSQELGAIGSWGRGCCSWGAGQAVPGAGGIPVRLLSPPCFQRNFGPPAAPVTRSSTDSIVPGPGWASGAWERDCVAPAVRANGVGAGCLTGL